MSKIYHSSIFLIDILNLSNQPVRVTSRPECWLGELTLEQNKTLLRSLQDCLNSTSFTHESHSSQVLHLADCVEFTNKVELSLKNDSSLLSINEMILDSIQNFIISNNTVDHAQRLYVKCMILEKIHQRDIIDYLIRNNVNDISSWHW